MRISPRVMRWAFYGLLAAGVMFLCGTIAMRSFDIATEVTGIGTVALASLCCLAPIVLGGIALANESR